MSVQLALRAAFGTRTPYVTGLQVPCAGCAAAGVESLGLPREGAEPLCMRCWLGRQQRDRTQARTELRTELWEGLGDAQDVAECPACWSDLPSADCWLCGWQWLAQAREQFEADQEAAAAAQEISIAQRFAVLAEITQAEQEADRWARIADRCRQALDAIAGGGRRARPVLLLAAAYARLGIPERNRRGRRPAWPRVAAVMALESDYRSGRRSRPGRATTAALLGVSERAVTEAWRILEDRKTCPERPGQGEIGPDRWALRTVAGRRTTLAERQATGLHRIRAQFDIEPAHAGPTPARHHEAAAAATFADLLADAVTQHEHAAQLVDELRAAQGTPTDPSAYAHRARLRAAVRAAQTTDIDEKVSSPLPVGVTGMSVYSGPYLGLSFRRCENSRCPRRPGAAGGREEGRASRPAPTSRGCRCPSPPLSRPRTTQGRRRAGRRPAWAVWAPQLAQDLTKAWTWLREAPRAQVAATLGARLGPDWTAELVVTFVRRARGRRPLLEAPDFPVAYLGRLLDAALDGLSEPPAAARLHDVRRRQLVEDERAELLAAAAAQRAEHAAREAIAVPRDAARFAREFEAARAASRRASVTGNAPELHPTTGVHTNAEEAS